MTTQVNLYGKIKAGKLDIINRQVLIEWIKHLPEGEDIIIKVNLQKNYKSVRQLRLLYACFRQIAYHTGQNVEDIKLILKLKAGLCFSHDIEGENITVCKSLSEFTKQEVSEFIQFVNQWAIDSLNLPLLTSEDIQFLKE